MVGKSLRAAPCLAFLIVVAGSLAPDLARGTSRYETTLPAVVHASDLVGIVECTLSGGFVARYRVVESWKGPAAGTSVVIGVTHDVYGSPYPLAAAGERFVVAARETSSRWGGHAFSLLTAWGGNPVWFRQHDSVDYVMNEGDRAQLSRFESDSPHAWAGIRWAGPLDSLRQDVSSLVESRDIEGEALLSVSWLAVKGRSRTDAAWASRDDVRDLQHSLAVADAARIADAWIEFAEGGPEHETLAMRVFSQAGGRVALDRLAAMPDSQSSFFARSHYVVVPALRRALGLDPPIADVYVPQTTETALDSLRARMRGGWRDRQYQAALHQLVERDVDSVVAFLRVWEDTSRMIGPHAAEMWAASYVAWKCPEPRSPRLRALLEASDQIVRVVAATYLSYEDSLEGVHELERLTAEDGDAGAFAAYELARRGGKETVPRAMMAWNTRGEYGVSGQVHQLVQLRLLELLSNSAAASGVELPPVRGEFMREHPELYPPYAEALMTWWARVADEIRVSDPWLPELAAQKVD